VPFYLALPTGSIFTPSAYESGVAFVYRNYTAFPLRGWPRCQRHPFSRRCILSFGPSASCPSFSTLDSVPRHAPQPAIPASSLRVDFYIPRTLQFHSLLLTIRETVARKPTPGLHTVLPPRSRQPLGVESRTTPNQMLTALNRATRLSLH
jgi:hypothetical protein